MQPLGKSLIDTPPPPLPWADLLVKKAWPFLGKAWFTRAIFTWQVFFDKFYLPVWTGKIAVFFTCQVYLFKIKKKLDKKKLAKWNLSSYETCSCGRERERQDFLTSFIWQVLFACVEGQNCQFFPCQVKLACQLLNKSIGEMSKQTSKRKSETDVANKYNTAPGSLQPAANCPLQFQTKLARLLTEVEQCNGGGRTTQLLFFLKTWGPKNRFGTSKSRLMETNQRKSRISRSYLKRSRMSHRKVSTQKRSKVIIIQVDKYCNVQKLP